MAGEVGNFLASRVSDLSRCGAPELAVGVAEPRLQPAPFTRHVRGAQERVRALVEDLKQERFSEDEIRRLFEAELLYPEQLETMR